MVTPSVTWLGKDNTAKLFDTASCNWTLLCVLVGDHPVNWIVVLPAIVPYCTSPNDTFTDTTPDKALPKLNVLARKLRVNALLIRVLAISLLTVELTRADLTITLFCRSVISVPAVFKLILMAAKLSLNPWLLLFTPGIG